MSDSECREQGFGWIKQSDQIMICPVNNVEHVIVLILHCLVILSL